MLIKFETRWIRDILELTQDKQGQTRDSQGQNRDNQGQLAYLEKYRKIFGFQNKPFNGTGLKYIVEILLFSNLYNDDHSCNAPFVNLFDSKKAHKSVFLGPWYFSTIGVLIGCNYFRWESTKKHWLCGLHLYQTKK